MEIGVPSRFACLKIEGEEKPTQATNKLKDKKSNEKKNKKSEKQINSKKVHNKQPNKINQKKKKKELVEQWEEWKNKDSELLNGNFEQDLQNALLLSKIDYEENKNNVKLEKVEEKCLNKKRKNKPISLDKFLSGEIDASVDKSVDLSKLEETCNDFFVKLEKNAKDQIVKEQLIEKRRERDNNAEETITILKYQKKLEQEINKNAKLEIELAKIKKEQSALKERYKTLCFILAQGEMKDKAEILMEVKTLTSTKTELTEEITNLYGLLEQERTKVANLTTDHHNKHREKVKK